MTPPEDNKAERLIESHIATLDQHKGQLERALARLKGPVDGEGQNRGGQGGRGPGRRGQGRQAQGASADLKANPGSKAAEVSRRVGINPTHAQTILANLVKQGVATKEGQQYTAAAG